MSIKDLSTDFQKNLNKSSGTSFSLVPVCQVPKIRYTVFEFQKRQKFFLFKRLSKQKTVNICNISNIGMCAHTITISMKVLNDLSSLKREIFFSYCSKSFRSKLWRSSFGRMVIWKTASSLHILQTYGASRGSNSALVIMINCKV